MSLILVPTPIGNLEDITLRALRILKEADLILAEDTRKTGILLKHYAIENQLSPYHKFNEHKELQRIVERILQLRTVALVTDAGTPGISDPGFLLVRECLRQGIPVECLPARWLSALFNSGFRRTFVLRFSAGEKRQEKKWNSCHHCPLYVILYESPSALIRHYRNATALVRKTSCISRS